MDPIYPLPATTIADTMWINALPSAEEALFPATVARRRGRGNTFKLKLFLQ
jgi:hypothetical protein